MSRRRRTGFTLVELLVVLAIVGLFASLALAGVQRVRAAAARTACGNGLRQIALALQNYHGVHGRLPAGTEPPTRSAFPYLAWTARLLPFLEQAAVWHEAERAYRLDPVFWHVPPHGVREQRLPAFACPADPRVLNPPQNWPGLTSYAGVSGTQTLRADGCLFLGSAVRLGDITDGASQTLLVGERPPSTDFRFGWWYAGFGQPENGSAFDAYLGAADRNFARTSWVPEYKCPIGPYAFGPGRFSDQCDTFHFWSPHPGGAHFAFADGSVRFLRYAAADLLPALATRAGGEAVATPE